MTRSVGNVELWAVTATVAITERRKTPATADTGAGRNTDALIRGYLLKE
jgi:hypothetical protein